MVFRPALIPYKLLICAVKAPAPMKWSCQTILDKARSWRDVVFWRATMDLPGTKVPVAAYLWRMQLTVTRVRPTRPAISCASTSCLIPMGVRKISENWEKLCNCWYELATVQRHIWGNDHVSCGFGLWRSQLVLQWKSALCIDWSLPSLVGGWPSRITHSPWAEKVVHYRRWI